MDILVIGGTRFFGIPMVECLLAEGHHVTIATRGITPDHFGDCVSRITLNIYDEESVTKALQGREYDVVIDKMGYGSKDVKAILDAVMCRHFIHMSTAGVYQLDHFDIREEEYAPEKEELVWCTRGDLGYDCEKRMAEAAIVQHYSHLDYTMIRSPYVMGAHDYTRRLLFYVEHIMKEIPMYIDNLDAKISVANADETARFIAYVASGKGIGAVNCCSHGLFSIRELLEYVESVTGKRCILSADGEPAPYNGTVSYSLNLDKAQRTGFAFGQVQDWIGKVILDYIY